MKSASEIHLFALSLLGGVTLSSQHAIAANLPEVTQREQQKVTLANHFHHEIDIQDYWYSEKYDGIRAIWNGQYFETRQGVKLNPPKWFMEQLPKQSIDGELWAGRGQFNFVQRTVLDSVPNEQDWKSIMFMAFDLPHQAGTYMERYRRLERLINASFNPYLYLAEHFPLTSDAELDRILDNIERVNGEGVMLRNKNSRYSTGRSDDLLKVKSFQDDEAVVIGYKPGKGKYDGLTGSLLVKWKEEKVFYIGSGLSNKERNNPPPIGSVITFRYNGLTHSGLPRFARFSHLRQEMQSHPDH